MPKRRLGELDLVERFASKYHPAFIQFAFGILCFVAALFTRLGVDTFATGAGPFSLIYPAVLLATLFGGWKAGLVTFSFSFLHA